jgi:hypothetical protein
VLFALEQSLRDDTITQDHKQAEKKAKQQAIADENVAKTS